MKRHAIRLLRPNALPKSLRSFTPKRVGLLLLAGFAIGALMISLGWADDSQPAQKHHHKHKTHSRQVHQSRARHHLNQTPHARHQKAHKHAIRVVSHGHALPPPVAPVKEYSHPEGMYSLQYPAAWRLTGNDSAMVVRSRGENMERGVFGIVRRPDDQPNSGAVTQEFLASNRPTDLEQMPSRIAGYPATKVIGSNRENPSNRMVEYYVQAPNGHQYYVLLMAPRDQWPRYSASFNKMLNSLSLN